MNILLEIKQKIAKIIKSHTGQIIDLSQIAIPPDDQLGDLALPCFELAKKLKKAPNQVAADLAIDITGKTIIAKAQAAGPYLNFFLDKEALAKLIIDAVDSEKNDFGTNKKGKGQKIMIEYSQPNTHKEFHIGHLRNVCIGSSLVNIYRLGGYKVIAANYLGDIGAHVAKTLWYWQKYVKEADVPTDLKTRGEFLGQIYSKASQLVGEDKALKEEVQKVQQKLEAGDKDLLKLWKTTRKWSLDLFAEIYKIIGVKFDVYFYESEVEVPGKKIVSQLLKEGIAIKSEGAIIVDLKKYDLDVFLILKSDGTALYATKDLALSQIKFKKYKIDKSLYVIDVRQSMYFKQLFKTLELMGFKEEMIHVPYDFVKLKDGIISSRSGNVITFLEVYNKCLEKVTAEILKRHQDWPEIKVNDTAKKISLAALKFDLLKQSNNKIVTFDIDEALSLEGFTGPYIQYATVRINSILAKAPKIEKGFAYQHYLYENIEKSLLKKLALYPQVIEDILASNDPSALAHYLFGLASEFNSFYHEFPILQAEDKIKKARLKLIMATKQVLENGLNVLGIETVNEM